MGLIRLKCLQLWTLNQESLAKQNGAYKGRKAIEVDHDKFASVYKAWKADELTARQAMEMLNLKPNTFYRRVKEYEAK